MAGRFITERGLGDGIKSLFGPIFEALNKDEKGKPVPEEEQVAFPETARLILNALFSATVQSAFKEKACKHDDQMLVMSDQAIEEVTGLTDDLLISDEVVEKFSSALKELDAERAAQLRAALKGAGSDKRHEEPKEFLLADKPSGEGKSCFAHAGTSAFISQGLQSGEGGFEIAAGAAKVGINLKFAAVATIVGPEPEIKPADKGKDATTGFVPPKHEFTGQLKGKQDLSSGGGCGDGDCRDEWVMGTCKITILFGMKVKAGANVPPKLKDAMPQLGVDAGFVNSTVYSFRFLHYPRNPPSGIADPEK